MSHTDFITPFTMEESSAWPDDKMPEPRINVDQFSDLLLKRWPYTVERGRWEGKDGFFSYGFDFRIEATDLAWELDLNYSCFVTIKRANREILASLAYIYRQCVPREYKVYLDFGNREIPLDLSEEEILEIISKPRDEAISPKNILPDAL